MKRFFDKIVHMDKESLTVLPVGMLASFVMLYFEGWDAGWGYEWLNILSVLFMFCFYSVLITGAFSFMMKHIHEKEDPTIFDALKVAAVPCVILFLFFQRTGW